MKDNPLVSILIPVYNRVNLVGESIDSVINQTYKNIEIIIVDNCSTDGTWDLLQNFLSKDERIKIYQNTENIGPVKNWKRCIDEANGQYAKILFSDDTIEKNYIEETLKLLDEKTAFALSPIENFGEINNSSFFETPNKLIYTTEEYIDNMLIFNENWFPVSPGAALFRTNDLKRSLEIDIENPFDLDFNRFGAGNDLLIFLNTAIKYDYIKIAANTKSFFRAHKDSFTVSNTLKLYYDYSKLHFINIHRPDIKSKFKTEIYINMKKTGTSNTIYPFIEANLSYLYILMKLLKKIGQR